ncbi:uncharacterized protein LOC62_03G003920 [Vanrija pseudolonga]|uniref:Uncharacterized protein n=1 Tax=Vanrija pseudolonga TaxID=143232 RepID=A0AAF0Y4Z0_9TREE|nr:hypothetical protein LOC62_03G003920 [Vanrija pseudolonga]
MDAILFHAPYDALIALRGTCRALRARVDAYLHLVVSDANPGTDIVVSYPATRLGLAMPKWSRICRDPNAAHAMARAQVVDFHLPLRANVKQYASSLGEHVHTARFLPGGKSRGIVALAMPPGLPPPTQVVSFTPVEGCLRCCAGEAEIPNTFALGVQEGVKRFALNVRYNPDHPWLDHQTMLRFFVVDSLEQVVVLFSAEKGTCGTCPRPDSDIGPPGWLLELLATLTLHALAKPSLRITLVGVQDHHRLWLPYGEVHGPTLEESIRGGVVDRVDQLLEEEAGYQCNCVKAPPQVAEEDVRDYVQGMRFVSCAEYRQEVGEMQYGLEKAV